MDTESKDNANPTVLDASALPTRRGQQRARQRNDARSIKNSNGGNGESENLDENENGHESESEKYGLAEDAGRKEGSRRRRRLSQRRGNRRGGGGVSSSESFDGSGRSRLRNGRMKGNAFFDELLGASAGSRGYLDEVLDGEGEDDDGKKMTGIAVEDDEKNMDVDVDVDIDINVEDEADDDDDDDEDEEGDEIDSQEIYDLIAPISDPEHPLSLGSLAVVNLPDIHLQSSTTTKPNRKTSQPYTTTSPPTTTRPQPPTTTTSPPPTTGLPPMTPTKLTKLTKLTILLTPTITHCSLATVIGLAVRVRLEQALPPRFRVSVRIKPGTHTSAEAVSKQLADKERVAAALENGALRGVLRKMMATCG